MSAWSGRSRDLDLADPGRRRSLCDVEGQQAKSVGFACRVHRPPDVVTAGLTRGQGRLVAEWACVALERGESDAAIRLLVTVVEQVTEHGSSVPHTHRGGISGPP
jgi:hypothetical protein